jgi:hypothetical protein
MTRAFHSSARVYLVGAICFCALFVFEHGHADSIWQRSSGAQSREARQTLASIERALTGRGTDRDLLRVRVALINLAKGDIEDPRAIVLLMRLRRELAFSTGRLSELQLSRAIGAQMSHTMRAWGYLELSHFSLKRRDFEEASAHLDRARLHAWRPDVREEVQIFQAWLMLRRGRAGLAAQQFSALEGDPGSRRGLLQSKVGRALCAAVRGDMAEFERLSREAISIENNRATVSGRDSFWELELEPLEQRAVGVVMRWKQVGGAPAEDDEIAPACELLFSDQGGMTSSPAESRGELISSLERLLAPMCSPAD